MPDEEEFVTTWGDTTTIYSTIIGEDNLATTVDGTRRTVYGGRTTMDPTWTLYGPLRPYNDRYMMAATVDPSTIKSTANRPTDEPSDEGSGEKSADNDIAEN